MDCPLLPLAHAKKVFIVLLTGLNLQGCLNGEGFSSAESVQSAGWARVEREDVEDQAALYCYRSLGAIDCYEKAVQGRENQLVTPYPPKPPVYKSFLTQLFEDTPSPDDQDHQAIPVRKVENASYEDPQPSQGWPDSSTPKAQESSAGDLSPLSLK
jgi:hypothetical protein